MALGNRATINLCNFSRNGAGFTIEQFIAELESTTTLTNLRVKFDGHESSPEHSRRVIEPLCRCIANLRRHSPNHPLRTLSIVNDSTNDKVSDDVNQFLIAAKQYGIHQLTCFCMSLPIQSLVEFCRDNTHLKILIFFSMCISDDVSTLSVSPQVRPLNSSAILNLDGLLMINVMFANSSAATKFLKFMAHINVSSLKLDRVAARWHGLRAWEITKRIVSELTFPSVQRLELKDRCQIEHFQAALVAGMATVTELTVEIHLDGSETTARLDLLASMIRGASQLNSLTLHTTGKSKTPKNWWLRPLHSAMDACVTVTRIAVTPMVVAPELQAIAERNRELTRCMANPSIYDRSDELVVVLELQAIAERNRELTRCMANPNTFYRSDELPELMGRFANCPTGRYMLVRCLPGIISFDKIQSATNRKCKR